MITVQGKITHAGKPLANVNISLTDANGNWYPVNGYNIGRESDAKGFFSIPVTNEDSFVMFSAVGYKPLLFPAQAAATRTDFKMQLDEQNLPGVTINTNAPRTRATVRPAAQMLASMPDLSNKKYLMYAGIAAAVVVLGIGAYFLFRKK